MTPAHGGTIASAQSSYEPLRGQRVVIVGGTSGMGLGAARAAAAAGAAVIVAGRRPIGQRDGTHTLDAKLEHCVTDVTDESSVRRLFEQVRELDHLFVTAAPAAAPCAFREQDIADVQRYINAKFFGAWLCARHAALRLHPRGSITFLTGCASVRPRAGISAVTSAFAALEALSRALALELGPLRVNTIRPGLVDSAMWDFLDAQAREELRRKTRATFPVGRIGTIEDIGHAAIFLMTNPYVTGAVLEVSGGETLVALDL